MFTDPKAVLPHVWGGDVHDKLSDTDIDRALSSLGARRGLAARFFYDMREGHGQFHGMGDLARRGERARTLIDAAIVESHDDPGARWIYCPVHVRQHWLGGFFCPGRNVGYDEPLVFLAVDSAPSPITAKDLTKLASALGARLVRTAPLRQPPYSNQCGLFTVLWGYVAAFQSGTLHGRVADFEHTNGPVVDLDAWRAELARDPAPTAGRAVNLMDLVPIPGHVWHRRRCPKNLRWAKTHGDATWTPPNGDEPPLTHDGGGAPQHTPAWTPRRCERESDGGRTTADRHRAEPPHAHRRRPRDRPAARRAPASMSHSWHNARQARPGARQCPPPPPHPPTAFRTGDRGHRARSAASWIEKTAAKNARARYLDQLRRLNAAPNGGNGPGAPAAGAAPLREPLPDATITEFLAECQDDDVIVMEWRDQLRQTYRWTGRVAHDDARRPVLVRDDDGELLDDDDDDAARGSIEDRVVPLPIGPKDGQITSLTNVTKDAGRPAVQT
ncbi:MAG: hypothetical protein AB7O67_24020, partial [Vicinamibacterales bacterium]